MTTEIKSTQTARWLSDGTPRWLPHELHNWVNSRTRGGRARVAAAPSTTTAPTTA